MRHSRTSRPAGHRGTRLRGARMNHPARRCRHHPDQTTAGSLIAKSALCVCLTCVQGARTVPALDAVAAILCIVFISAHYLPFGEGRIAFMLFSRRFHRGPNHWVLVRVRTLLVVLPEQILPIIVPVRRPDHSMDVLAGRLARFQMRQRDR
jgi:hypothetical protein